MLRIDWPKVKALSVDAGLLPTDSALFILPVAGRDLLMSAMERYEWQATYRLPTYDYSDWDLLQSIVAATENGLMGFELVSDIVEQLDRIATALEECCTIPVLTDIHTAIENLELSPVVNVDVSGGGGCGNTTEKTWLMPDGWQENHPEQPVPDDDTATGETSSYLCDSAHSSFSELVSWISLFADNVADISPYDKVWEVLSLSSLFKASGSQYYTILSVFTSVLYNQLVEDSVAFMESLKDDYICNMVNSPTAVDFRAWFAQALRADPPNWTVGFWLETLYTGTSFNSIYDGTYVPFPEFIGSDCSLCEHGDFKITQWAIVQTGQPQEIISERYISSGETIVYSGVADQSHYSTSGNESWLYIFEFTAVGTGLAAKVDCALVAHSGWTAPTNTNHPLSVQRLIYGGGSQVIVPLGQVPSVPINLSDVDGMVFHSKTQFSVSFSPVNG